MRKLSSRPLSGFERIAVGEFAQGLPLSIRAEHVRAGQSQLAEDPDYLRDRALRGIVAGGAGGLTLWKAPDLIAGVIQRQRASNWEGTRRNLSLHAATIFQGLPPQQKAKALKALERDFPFTEEGFRGALVNPEVPRGAFSPQGMESLLKNLGSRSFPGARGERQAGEYISSLLGSSFDEAMDQATGTDAEERLRALAPTRKALAMAGNEDALSLAVGKLPPKLRGISAYLASPIARGSLMPRGAVPVAGLMALGGVTALLRGRKDREDLLQASERSLKEIEQYLIERDVREASRRHKELTQNELEGRASSRLAKTLNSLLPRAEQLTYLANLSGLASDPSALL